jgi:hypothetical protein
VKTEARCGSEIRDVALQWKEMGLLCGLAWVARSRMKCVVTCGKPYGNDSGVSVPGACAMGGADGWCGWVVRMGGADGEERALVVRLIGEEVDRDVGRLVMVAGMNCGYADGGQELCGHRGQPVQGATAGSM